MSFLNDKAARQAAREQALAQIATAISRRRKRCPWNPFPADCAWGQQIDERYARDLEEGRSRRTLSNYGGPREG